jgi:hypothetical protein
MGQVWAQDTDDIEGLHQHGAKHTDHREKCNVEFYLTPVALEPEVLP